MHTIFRTMSIPTVLLSIGLFSLAIPESVEAAGRGRAVARHPDAHRSEIRREEVPGAPGIERRPAVAPGRDPAAREDVRATERRRGCRRGVRRAADVRCDYYYDDDDDEATSETVYESESGGVGTNDAAAKIAPAAPRQGGQGDGESFTSHGSEQLVDELMAAHQAWQAKKERLAGASKELADAEYQAYQSGGSVDPELVARRESAQAEANQARAAMQPLVEQAREAGISPRVLDLYEGRNPDD